MGFQEHFNRAFAKVFTPNYFREPNALSFTPFIYKWTYFFGLPNALAKGETTLTPMRVLKKFFAWPASGLSACLVPVKILWNCLCVIGKIAWNPIGFVCEFIPYFFYCIATEYYERLKLSVYEQTSGEKFPILSGKIRHQQRIPLLLAFALFSFCGLLWHLGRCLSSPGMSVWDLYHEGQAITPGLGFVLATLSLGVSLCFYLILLPLTLQAIVVHSPLFVAQITTFVQSHLPWMLNAANKVALSPAIQVVASTLLNLVDTWVATTIFATLSLVYSFALAPGFLKIASFVSDCFAYRRKVEVEEQVTDNPLGSDEYLLRESSDPEEIFWEVDTQVRSLPKKTDEDYNSRLESSLPTREEDRVESVHP